MMINKQSKLYTLLLILFLTGNIVHANPVDIFVTSFESNSTGSINGQDNWSISDGSATVTEDALSVKSGSKGLNFIASNNELVVSNIAFTDTQAGVGGVVYLDMWVKINSMDTKDFAINGYDLFGGGSQKRAFVLEFDTPSGSTGDFRMYNGSTKLPIGTFILGEWNRVSARIDYDKSIYQVIFNNSEASSANFREDYTPTSGVKSYHEMRFNLGYDGASGNVNASVDDIYVSTNPIADIIFPGVEIYHTMDVEQPNIGSISLNPDQDTYLDSTEITASLTIPEGYRNAGWTDDLSGTSLDTTFLITSNMKIGAVVEVDPTNPPAQYTITVTQPDFGSISLTPAGGIYYDQTNIEAKLDVPPGYINTGWTGDLSGTDPIQKFVISSDMNIGATVIWDTTPATIYTVSTASELEDICEADLHPGDIVEVADGRYDAGGIQITSSGTADKPIIIRAKNVGGAELVGETYFTFRGVEYVQFIGFTISSSIYTAIKLEACNNIRIARNTFQITETEGQNGKWLYIGGVWDDPSKLSHHNRVDHNIFRNKHQLGNFITIDGGDNVSQHDLIDHNYFYNIGPRHENEMEAIRIGWSELSLTDGFTVVEYNLFEACDGDPEIVSVKSCKDTLRYNTFRSSQGTLSLRHGDGSVIHDNFFLGEGKEGTGGVRIYARNHKIYNNYFEGLTGSVWDAAITLTNGDTDTGSLSAHWRIDNAIVANNTLVNNFSNIEIGYAKADNSWKKEPRNVNLSNNLVLGSNMGIIEIITTPTNFTWSGNIMYPQGGAALGMTATDDQIKQIDPLLVNTGDLWVLSGNSPAIDASQGGSLTIIDDIQGQAREGALDVGADEYSSAPITRLPLLPKDVGPEAVEPVSVQKRFEIPSIFKLLKNYPNPFNPSTILVYDLPHEAFVELVIFDLRGQVVSTLVEKPQTAGHYQLIWDGSEQSSGIYIAQLKTGNTVSHHKLVLVK